MYLHALRGFGARYRSFPAFLARSNCLKTAKLRRRVTLQIWFNVTGDEGEEDSQEIFLPSSSTKRKVVTDAEAAEMGRVLQDMKSLALGIQEEQERQLQQLDLLSDSVDKANERIRTDVRKVKKLT